MVVKGWIGVDLDGTLAEYHGWGDGSIGKPIPLMIERVKRWLSEGREVRIVTARVWCDPRQWDYAGARGRSQESYEAEAAIQAWCRTHLGVALPVTCMKDFGMIELWDDRAIQVLANTGVRFRGGN
jgi:hypothetical protein